MKSDCRHNTQCTNPSNFDAELTEDESLELAKQYSFSGGQIENIARKQLVNAVLTGEDKVDLETIQEACKTESFKTSTPKRIGFC